MTQLASLPRPALLALFLWGLSLVMLFLLAVRQEASSGRIGATIGASMGMGASYLSTQCPLSASASPNAHVAHIPLAASALTLVALTIWAIACHARLRRDRGERISPRSVKAAIDALPLGVLYYRKSGLVKLANTTMEELSWTARGTSLQDGSAFWSDVCPQGGDTAEAHAADSRHVTFSRSVVEIDGTTLFEVIATDVSAERAINSQIEQENERLRKTSERLRAWYQVAADVTTAREIVEAKARVHDELGRASVACRRYLQDGGTRQGLETVLAQWEGAVAALRSREARLAPQGELAFESILEAAQSVGLRLQVEGELPRTAPAARAVVAVCTEALLNASQHAHASTLFLRCERVGQAAEATVSNDGEPPGPDAHEGGGLAIARSRVESAGGTMRVEWHPTLSIHCTLPDDERGQTHGS